MAFITVGAFIVYGMFGGMGALIDKAMSQPDIKQVFETGIHGGALLTVTWLSFVCIFLLPRQFHVTFVENASNEELRNATWLFPLYLVVINIFVAPVAMAGTLVFRGLKSRTTCTFLRFRFTPEARSSPSSRSWADYPPPRRWS